MKNALLVVFGLLALTGCESQVDYKDGATYTDFVVNEIKEADGEYLNNVVELFQVMDPEFSPEEFITSANESITKYFSEASKKEAKAFFNGFTEGFSGSLADMNFTDQNASLTETIGIFKAAPAELREAATTMFSETMKQVISGVKTEINNLIDTAK